jgi:succinoglycan biosynthesis protein ExoA
MDANALPSEVREKPLAGDSDKPKALAVIPCLNEAAHIEDVAVKLLEDADALDLLIVIADGGSTDGTIEIAQRLAAEHPQIAFLKNEQRIQSAAINRAVEAYGAGRDYLIRVDAHCNYPSHYCKRLIEIQKETGSDSVVVSMAATGTTCFQRAAAAAQNSRLGNGGAAHRSGGRGRFIDHGHHALMLIPAFRGVRGYDETFSHNEDAELDTRLGKAGFSIWLTGEMSLLYFPRSSARALFRQYLNYGRGRAKTLFKHRKWPRVRQSLPLAVAPAVALALLSPLEPLLSVPALSWASICIVYGLLHGLAARSVCTAFSGVAAMIMHFAWSFGFLSSLLKLLSARSQEESPASAGVLAPTSPDELVK